jgi:hypothetical protein
LADHNPGFLAFPLCKNRNEREKKSVDTQNIQIFSAMLRKREKVRYK